MQNAVLILQNATNESKRSLDEIEQKIVKKIPEANEILDLCKRLRDAKSKLLELNEKISKLRIAQELFNQALSENLFPAAEIIEKACVERDLPKPKVEVIKTMKEQEQTYDNEIQATPTKIYTKNNKKKQSTPKKSLQKRSISNNEFREITEEEYATFDTRTFGYIGYNEIKNLYKVLWDFAQENEPGKIITRREIVDLDVKLNILQSALRFLKSLKRIELTKDGDVKTVF